MSHASPAHDAPLELLREAPRVLLALLEVAGVRVIADAEVEVVSADLHEAVPTHRAADLVALVRDVRGEVALVVIVEVQRRADPRKRRTWPLYTAQLEAKHDADAVLVVLALESERVAAWARSPSRPWSTTPFAPLVLGPETVAELLAPRAPRPGDASPTDAACELAVLGAMARLAAHGRRRALSPRERAELTAALAAALAAIRTISDSERVTHLLALLHSVARQRHARAILMGLLEANDMNTLERLKKDARLEGLAEGVALGKAEGVVLGKAEGVALGKAEGVALGKAEGVALGKAEGEAKGKADALLRLLRRRGFEIDAALEKRVLCTTDVSLLDRWFDRAIDAATIEVVFGRGHE